MSFVWRPLDNIRSRRRDVDMSMRLILAAAVVVAVLGYAAFIHTPPGPHSLRAFDADRTAALELDMWQAYYTKANVRLFRDLVIMLREQYRYTWARALVAGFRLARAAARFGNMRSDYEQVLPDLTAAYAMARGWTGARFDAAAVARAELAWWVARREPGHDSAEQVGQLIAEEYALLYEAPVAQVAEAGLLRARAAKLRDDGGEQADWVKVAEILRDSYRALAARLR